MAPRQHRKSKLDPYMEKVGVVPDAEVAFMAGVTAENVRAFRKSRGIPARWREEAEPQAAEQATKKGKTTKPKAKKANSKPRKASAKTLEAAPLTEQTVAVEQVTVAAPEVEPELEATPASAEGPSLELDQPVEAEAATEPAPVPLPAPKQKRKPAKPQAKKPAIRTPQAKKPAAGPVVEPKLAIMEAAVVEPVVEAEPAPEPVVEAEPAEGLPPEPKSAPAPAPRVSSTRKPRRTKLDAHLDKVGLLSDKQVADLAGVTPENIRTYRVRRGIPARWRGEGEGVTAAITPVTRPSAKPATGDAAGVGRARRGKLTPYMDQIGIVPDARIAELSGTTLANVRAFRLRHDIPARWRGDGEPLPNEEAIGTGAVEEPSSPAAVPVVPAPVTLLEAYVVTVEGPEGAVEYAVVSRDIVEATISAVAGMARAGITGKLVATRFLARVLEG